MTPDAVEAVLSKFLATEENGGRYDIHKVCVKQGWRFATDGRACIRIKSDLPDTPNGPDVVGLGWDKFGTATYLLPDGKSEFEACKTCSGTGKTRHEKCDECGGEGSVECDHGYEHDCPECEDGWVNKLGPEKPCHNCGGVGKIELPKCLPVGEIKTHGISSKYATLLKGIGVESVRQTPNGQMLYFSVGEMDGIVMSMLNSPAGDAR